MNIGRYEVKEQLGKGGMGSILRAYDPNLGRFVALKTLIFQGDATQLAAMKERFKREARNAAQLTHPNIVVIHDFDVTQEPAYLVMELIQGKNLRQLLQANRLLPLAEKLRILRDTAAALDYAHGRNVIHRDVKPENIMIGDEDGAVKLTDFGIAKSLEPSMATHTLTEAGMMAGTPHYIPPEAIDGEVWGRRGDQYSLAVVAFETLLGRRPFQAPTIYALFFAIKSGEPPPLRQISRHFPEPGYVVLLKALSKQPLDRYSTCVSFIDALRAGLEGYEDTEQVLADIKEELSLWNRLSDAKDQSGYREFLNRYPESQFKEEAQQKLLEIQLEDASWLSAREDASPEAMRRFLSRFPDGVHAEAARRFISTLEREDAQWMNVRASTNIADLEAFLREFPDGKFEGEARDRLAELQAEQSAWNSACQQNSTAAYRIFLRQFPRGMYASKAEQVSAQLEGEHQAWMRARDSNDADTLQQFLAAYPSGRFASQAHSRLDYLGNEFQAWKRARKSRTEGALQQFLNTFPEGPNASGANTLLAQVRREASAWDQVRVSPNAQLIEGFIEQYPESAFVQDAQARVDALRAEATMWEAVRQKPTRETINAYRKRFPEGVHAKDAEILIDRIEREWKIWQKVNPQDPAALERFLKDWPSGQFADQAQQKLQELRSVARQEAADWLALQPNRTDIHVVSRFLEKYPLHQEAQQLKQHLEDEARAWQVLDPAKEEHLKRFLEFFPDGRNAATARAKLEELLKRQREENAAFAALKQKGANREALQRFLREFPAGAHRQEALEWKARLDEEHEAWQAVSPTNQAELKAFLDKYPQGQFAIEARRAVDRIESEQWSQLEKSPDKESVTRFLKTYSGSKFAEAAKKLKAGLDAEDEAWQKVDSARQSHLAGFLKQFPDGQYAPLARNLLESLKEAEAKAWGETEKALNRDTLAAFLKKFPDGQFKDSATKLHLNLDAEWKAWEAADVGNPAAIRSFLQGYPNGQLVGTARERLEDLEWKAIEKTADRDAFDRFLKAWPKGKHSAEALRRKGSLDSEWTVWSKLDPSQENELQAFLQQFPSGQYSELARRNLGNLKQQALWEEALATQDVARVRAYIDANPNSVYMLEAKALLERLSVEALAWQNLPKENEAELRSFLQNFPGGQFAPLAKKELERLAAARRQAVDQQWELMKTGTVDVKAVTGFLKQYPDAPQKTEADQLLEALRREEDAWQKLDRSSISAAAEKALEDFLVAFPKGSYHEVAAQRLREIRTARAEEERLWNKARKANTAVAYRDFLKECSDGRFAQEARQALEGIEAEERAWVQLQKEPDSAALGEFLLRYPRSLHAGDARTLLAALEKTQREWERLSDSDDIAQLENFASKNKGPFAWKASTRAVALRKQQSAFDELKRQPNAGACRQFLTEYPNSRREPEVRQILKKLEEAAWGQIDTPASLRQFLKEFPDGDYYVPAKERLAAIERKKQLRVAGMVAVVLAVVAAGGLAVKFWPEGSKQPGPPISETPPVTEPKPPVTTPPITTPPPVIDPGAELAVKANSAWKLVAQNNLKSLEDFVREFPTASHLQEAQQRITFLQEEAKTWAQVKNATAAEEVEAWLKRFPNGQYAAEANKALVALQGDDKSWATFLTTRDEAALKAYVQNFPQGRHVADARRIQLEIESTWQKALASRDPGAMDRYVRENPKSSHLAEARTRLDEWITLRDWNTAKAALTIPSLEGFIKQHPASPYDAEARTALEDLYAEDGWNKVKGSVQEQDLQNFITRFTKSKRRKEAEDRLQLVREWTTVRTNRKELDVAAYIDRRKGGPFENDARKLLEEILKEKPVTPPVKPPTETTPPVTEGPKPTITGKDALVYVRMSGGSFRMGCLDNDPDCKDPEIKQALATSVPPFYIGRTEVPVSAFKKFADATGLKWKPSGSPDMPAVEMRATDAAAYCAWVGGRLPAEREWEFAARGGKTELYIGGNEASTRFSNFGMKGLKPVGALAPNGYGLYDMTGNVSEWVTAGSAYVLRGGTFGNGPKQMRISYRYLGKASDAFNGTGFRCVANF